MNGLGLANRRSERYELHGSLFTVKNFVVNNTFRSHCCENVCPRLLADFNNCLPMCKATRQKLASKFLIMIIMPEKFSQEEKGGALQLKSWAGQLASCNSADMCCKHRRTLVRSWSIKVPVLFSSLFENLLSSYIWEKQI